LNQLYKFKLRDGGNQQVDQQYLSGIPDSGRGDLRTTDLKLRDHPSEKAMDLCTRQLFIRRALD